MAVLTNEKLLELNLVHAIHTTERRSFRSCRRRWNWVFREFYYPTVTARALEFGVAFHKAMETWYDPITWKDPDREIVNQGLALTVFTETVKEQFANYKRLNGEPSPELKADYDDRVQLGISMIKYYTGLLSPRLDTGFTPVGVEVPFEISMGFNCKCDICWKRWLKYWNGRLEEYQQLPYSDRAENRENWDGLPVTYGGRVDMIAQDNNGRLWLFDWKACLLTTRVVTPDGWKTMEEIKVGDFVIGADGKPTEVLGEKTRNPESVYEVVFTDGTIVECSADHLWKVHNGHNDTDVVLTTEQIMNKPNYVTYSIDPLSGPVEFTREARIWDDVPMHPYVLGSLIGDGCFTGNILTYASQSGETVELLKKYATEDVVIKDQRGHGAVKWQITGPWKDQLEKLGLWGKRSGEKWIPPDYKYASVEDRILLLQGLCDTDGNTGLLRWSTTSKQLADDFRHLVWSLGGTADLSIVKERTHQNGTTVNVDQYLVNYKFSTNIEPNQLERKRVGRVVRQRKTRRRIKEVRKTNRQEPMKCIYVASPEHLFATENFILTHNTTGKIMDAGTEEAFLELEDQVTSYVVAFHRLGRPVAGFVYHEQKKAIPEPPKKLTRIVKGRSYSTAKNANTTYEDFLREVSQNDYRALEAGFYDDYLLWLRNEGPQFYQRHQVHRNRHQIETAWEEMIEEAKDIILNPRIYSQPSRFGCNTCAFRQPCLGKNMGEDYYYTLDTLFEKRTKHYFEEEEPITND